MQQCRCDWNEPALCTAAGQTAPRTQGSNVIQSTHRGPDASPARAGGRSVLRPLPIRHRSKLSKNSTERDSREESVNSMSSVPFEERATPLPLVREFLLALEQPESANATRAAQQFVRSRSLPSSHVCDRPLSHCSPPFDVHSPVGASPRARLVHQV
jgi:hypothetical protein